MRQETRSEITCRSCSTTFEIARHPEMRWIAAGFGAVVGGAVTESFLGAVLAGGVFYGGAALYDERRARRCPSCHDIVWRGAAPIEEKEYRHRAAH